jgi:hypothetical protein
MQGAHLTRQCTPAANQCCDSRSEGGIQSLDVGSVDHAGALGLLDQGFDLSLRALHHATGHPYHASSRILFDNLGDVNTIPWPQTGPSRPAIAHRLSEDTLNGPDVGLVSVNTEQQRATQSTVAHSPDQLGDQIRTPGRAEGTAQPKSRLNLNRHRQPQDAALNFGIDFISLYLTQITWLLHQVFVYLLAVISSALFQAFHCAFVHFECCHNSLTWTPESQQCDNLNDDIFGQTPPVEDGAFGGRERAATFIAYVPSFFAAVHTNISFADVAPCVTSGIGAKYSLWVHWFTLLVGLATKPDCDHGPRFVKLHLHHG